MKIKGAIFDLDGTLIDSMHFWDDLGAEYLRQKGIIPPNNINEVLKALSLEQSARYLKETYSITENEDEIKAEIINLIENQYRYSFPLKPYVATFLSRLYEKRVKMCIATATDRELATAALKRLGIAGYFDFILTCTEAGIGKNDPRFFLKALEMLKTPKSETIVFEDALHAIKSAKLAGLYVVAVYDKSSDGDKTEIKSAADIYINSFEDWEMIS